MAWENIQEKYIPKDNAFYRLHYHQIIIGIMVVIIILFAVLSFTVYQMLNRPQPVFNAAQANGEVMQLRPYEEPNLLPSTILRWASKAATVAYTYDYAHYREQIDAARLYFTQDGWNDFGNSLSSLLDRVVQNKLIVTSVVYDTPVISNQGPLPGYDYVWKVQIPFLVTYQSENTQVNQKYYVVLTIVRVPTAVNPQGIGIDRFVMV